MKDTSKNRRWLYKSCFYVTITEFLVGVYFTGAYFLGFVSWDRYLWTLGRLMIFFCFYLYFTGILNRFAKKMTALE